jgi:hypothetical protein
MMRVTVLALALGLSGCGMLRSVMPMSHSSVPAPQPMLLSPKDRLVAAIAANNCLLTADNVDRILAQAQISQPDLRALTTELAAEGRAEVSGEGTIRVLTETCI